jgi:hypothetical protein
MMDDPTTDSKTTRRGFLHALLRIAGLGALAGAATLLGGKGASREKKSCPGGACGLCPDAATCTASTPPAKWTNREPEQQ